MAIVDGQIRCYLCGESKPLSEYQPSVIKAGCGACRSCKYTAKRAYEQRQPQKAAAARNRHRKANLDHHRAVVRDYFRRNPDRRRDYNLRRYDITSQEYDRLLSAQGGACACCGATQNRDGKRLFVDHDHETGAIRGLLCRKCNAGIGALGDDIAGVERALAYLKRAQPVRSAPLVRFNLLSGASNG